MRLIADEYQDALLMLVWERRELSEAIYDPVVGVANLPLSAIRYTYQRTWERTIERLAALSSPPPVPIRFELAGMQPLTLGPDGTEVGERSDPHDVVIRLRTRAIGSFRGSRFKRYWNVGIGFLRRHIRPVGYRAWSVLWRRRRSGLATLLIILRS